MARGELPIAKCRLDTAGLHTQRERYRNLGRQAGWIERSTWQLVVQFGDGVDEALIQETIALEAPAVRSSPCATTPATAGCR